MQVGIGVIKKTSNLYGQQSLELLWTYSTSLTSPVWCRRLCTLLMSMHAWRHRQLSMEGYSLVPILWQVLCLTPNSWRLCSSLDLTRPDSSGNCLQAVHCTSLLSFALHTIRFEYCFRFEHCRLRLLWLEKLILDNTRGWKRTHTCLSILSTCSVLGNALNRWRHLFWICTNAWEQSFFAHFHTNPHSRRAWSLLKHIQLLS